MSSANAPTLTLRRRPRRRGPLIPTLVVIAVVVIAFFALSSSLDVQAVVRHALRR